jgi:hypothetical protein
VPLVLTIHAQSVVVYECDPYDPVLEIESERVRVSGLVVDVFVEHDQPFGNSIFLPPLASQR